MIRKVYPTTVDLSHTLLEGCDPSGLLFFDIETTGFTARSSYLYLIGAVSYQKTGWMITQWFAENYGEEEEILRLFLDFSSHYSQVIHFNGERFDLPYLEEKAKNYGLVNTLSGLVSRDLFRLIRPLRPILQLNALNQKSLEEYLGLYRQDPFNGGELIDVYHQYVSSHKEDLLQTLLLHNYDDLYGMLSILPMLCYLPLLEGGYAVTSAQEDGDAIMIRALLPAPVPVAFSLQEECFYLSCQNRSLAMRISGTRKPQKHFFSDYQNYYYLPLEDTAIHKSVATYVDKEFRQPAKASTCYCKKKGFFLPQYDALFSPIFKEDYRSKIFYFACKDTFLQDKPALHDYMEHLLDQI